MSLDVESKPGTPTPPHRPRGRWVIAAAAIAVVVVAAVAAAVLWGGESDDHQVATDPVTTPTTAPTATGTPGGGGTDLPAGQVPTLRVSADHARCLVPTAAGLAQNAALAFEGTVGSIDNGSGTAVLQVSQWLHADGFGGTDTVRVALPPAGTETGLTLQPGDTYLIAATGEGQVMGCGFSGATTPRLTKLYDTAFR